MIFDLEITAIKETTEILYPFLASGEPGGMFQLVFFHTFHVFGTYWWKLENPLHSMDGNSKLLSLKGSVAVRTEYTVSFQSTQTWKTTVTQKYKTELIFPSPTSSLSLGNIYNFRSLVFSTFSWWHGHADCNSIIQLLFFVVVVAQSPVSIDLSSFCSGHQWKVPLKKPIMSSISLDLSINNQSQTWP